MANAYVIGVDYGTDSVRSVIVDAVKGKEVGSAVHYYSRRKAGKFCNPANNQFRQHPLDYLEGLEIRIRETLKKSQRGTANNFKCVSMGTTDSRVVASDKNGTLLSSAIVFVNTSNIMFIPMVHYKPHQEAHMAYLVVKNWGTVNYSKFNNSFFSFEWSCLRDQQNQENGFFVAKSLVTDSGCIRWDKIVFIKKWCPGLGSIPQAQKNSYSRDIVRGGYYE